MNYSSGSVSNNVIINLSETVKSDKYVLDLFNTKYSFDMQELRKLAVTYSQQFINTQTKTFIYDVEVRDNFSQNGGESDHRRLLENVKINVRGNRTNYQPQIKEFIELTVDSLKPTVTGIFVSSDLDYNIKTHEFLIVSDSEITHADDIKHDNPDRKAEVFNINQFNLFLKEPTLYSDRTYTYYYSVLDEFNSRGYYVDASGNMTDLNGKITLTQKSVFPRIYLARCPGYLSIIARFMKILKI